MNKATLPVRPGVTRLATSELHLLKGLRLGLITNTAGVDENGNPTASALLNAGADLVCLFCPEHGLDISRVAGEEVADSFDPITGLPVYSLYGATRTPSPDAMNDIDALIFDLQDVGVRCYTYIWTMALAMKSVASTGKLFMVLDRPNPLGGRIVQGPVLDPRFASFLGLYPVPLRHGMTIGELALMFNEAFEIRANLVIVRMEGWRRGLWFSDTGLPWTPPSPNIPSTESALLYSGACLLEGTNISEGRGTAAPFCIVGAPWFDTDIVNSLDKRWRAGLSVSSRRFTPKVSKYAGVECNGILISVLDKERADPVAFTVALLAELVTRHPDELKWNEKHFDRVAGTDAVRRSLTQQEFSSTRNPERLIEGWKDAHAEFERLRSRYLLYED